MTLPSLAAVRGAQAAASRMADRHTPFVFDDWYVAAFLEELPAGRLLPRTLLGRRVVLYRSESGAVVALDDRCPHRSMPLSAGRLEGDTIVCGYHGFRFDAAGDCIEVPSQPNCPKNVGVRAYPTVQRGPVVWIWMGEPAAADADRLVPQPWMTDPAWTLSQGSLRLQASYIRLHENLLDLTHLSYLHGNSFGTPDYAKAPFESVVAQGRFALVRNVMPTTLPPVWAQTTGLTGKDQAARVARSEFLGPGLHEVTVRFYDCTLPESQRQEYMVRTAHMPTPETATSTHYFIVHGRDFALGDDAVTHFMHEQLFVAFNEDVTGLALQEQALAGTPPEDLYEFSVLADGPAVAMRRYMQARNEGRT